MRFVSIFAHDKLYSTMRHRLTAQKAFLRLKEWEAITNLCLQLRALKYVHYKKQGIFLLRKILKEIIQEKKQHAKTSP